MLDLAPGRSDSQAPRPSSTVPCPPRALGGRTATHDPAVVDAAPVVAAICAVPQLLPQIHKIRASRGARGVSWSWAALTCIDNAAWMAYFDVSGDRTALLPACSVCVFAGVLAAMLAHYERPARRAVALVTVWVGLVLATYPLFGRVGLGTLLTAAFAVQVAPSIWSAYRTSDPSAISSGTWLLILAELACWAFYGAARSDPRLLALGITGVAASLSILGRAAMTWRSP